MKNTDELLKELASHLTEANRIYQPVFYNLTDKQHQKEFDDLLRSPGIIVADYIGDQINELIKYKSPWRKFSTNELQEETKKITNGLDLHFYGLWVYYPWTKRLVHILGREDFIDLRTSRNQYKITREERDILAQKKIGVIGLSVGQSVSVTLAMERICGELRLADFDVLELTNLNRIRTGIHNLGLPKVYSVAREILEIDPFIKVVCFPKGLTEENMDEFFTGGGKLDLLVEESDGFDIKILSRIKARSLHVPVIMEGSDRCAVDVERFDLEPDRSILHGLVDHLDVSKLKTLKTNEEKIPFMLDMLGIETASPRLKASMLEIEQSINTWPQLASSVTMGGGITADVARRMLLNHYTESGRYHVDVEELIGNKNILPEESAGTAPLTVIDFKALSQSLRVEVKPGQVNLSREEAETIVNAGCLAPSGGNIQPWRWAYHNQSLIVFNAFDLNHTLLGYDNLSSFVAIGAAIENARLRAAEMGLETRYEVFPVKNMPDVVAVLSFFKGTVPATDLHLAGAIGLRLTNRLLGQRQSVPKEILEKLSAAGAKMGADLRFFIGSAELDEIADLLGELERVRLLDETGHRDFVEEIRWTKEESENLRDGVDLRTLELTNTEKVGMEMSRDPKIMAYLNKWKGGGAFKKLTKKSIDAAGVVGILTMKKGGRADFLLGGMAIERVWLEATSNGIAFQPMSASVFTWARLLKGGGKGLSEGARESLLQLRSRFERVFALDQDSSEIFIFRLSIAKEPHVKSLRKPLDELFCYF